MVVAGLVIFVLKEFQGWSDHLIVFQLFLPYSVRGVDFLMVNFSFLKILRWGLQKKLSQKAIFCYRSHFFTHMGQMGQNWPKINFFLKVSNFSLTLKCFAKENFGNLKGFP